MIRVDNLNFEFPGWRTLDRVSFHIARGSITKLIRPDGAAAMPMKS